ncbi:(2Fe-2S)-binding protein [Aldersonia kunmingensis]|uniref:(2Fe-2S)-binding protein n=1 Tax=Aldersonia kunmingensis TaxID=408066 RepID=UPI00082DCEF8|nr:(2Fe-2S)-binding protein [Aldersonia kunmingensis]
MSPGPAEIGGVFLADRAGLDGLTRELAAQWRLPDQRVAGTLWWYMACDVLLSGPVRGLVAGAAIPDPTLESTVVTLRPDAGLAHVRHLGTCATPPDAHRALRDTLDRVIVPLAEASGAAPAALRALVADAVGTIALAAAPDRAEAAAQEIAAGIGDLPMPRFVEVAGRRFVHRVSCCMVDRIPGAEMCVSCPRRDSNERADLLARRARS